MKDQITISVVATVFIICLFLTWYFSHRARHRERLLMIEKGFPDGDPASTSRHKVSIFVKIGRVIIGLSLGFIIIQILGKLGVLSGDLIPLAVLGICGGTALLTGEQERKG